MATVVSQVGLGHYYIDYGGRVFKQSAEQLRHISERERLSLEAVREAGGEPPDEGLPGEGDAAPHDEGADVDMDVPAAGLPGGGAAPPARAFPGGSLAAVKITRTRLSGQRIA